MTQAQPDSTEATKGREALVVYRSLDGTGATYALERRTRERVRAFAQFAALPPRVFIAQESGTDYERVHGTVRGLVVQMLTGLSKDRLESIGPVEFVDPVTEQRLD
jgi:hypothetical protein